MIELPTNASVRIPLTATDFLGDNAAHPTSFLVNPADLATATLGPEGHDVVLTASGALGAGTVTVPGAIGVLEFTTVSPGQPRNVAFNEAQAVYSRRP
jgi:hypothetical protein